MVSHNPYVKFKIEFETRTGTASYNTNLLIHMFNYNSDVMMLCKTPDRQSWKLIE